MKEQLDQSPEFRKEFEETEEIHKWLENASVFKPSRNLSKRFYEMLDEERQNVRQVKLVNFSWRITIQVAAAVALLLVGFQFGKMYLTNQEMQNQLADIRTELDQTKENMLVMAEDQSLSSRIKAVNMTYELAEDDDIIKALIKLMNEDKSSNVRLAAIEALIQFPEHQGVRNSLVGTLDIQTDPVVQIAVINALISIREVNAVDELEKIVDQPELDEAVRKEAYHGLVKLS